MGSCSRFQYFSALTWAEVEEARKISIQLCLEKKLGNPNIVLIAPNSEESFGNL